MDYKNIIKEIELSKELISMVPLNRLVEVGYNLEMNKKTHVLDICCGFGAMLSIWNEAFSITGVGIDIFDQHIIKGNETLSKRNQLSDIVLLEEDAKAYNTDVKYDVVSMVGEDLFRDIKKNIIHMEKYLSNNGSLIYGTPYKKQDNIPQELIDFEGNLLTLTELYNLFRDSGYVVTDFACCQTEEWDRYVAWSSRRDMDILYDKNSDINKSKLDWVDTWYKMHFEYRRPYEGFVMFVLRKV
ncbi:methyltransferase domain-containing protein [Mycoplasmatota bacterium WC44]